MDIVQAIFSFILFLIAVLSCFYLPGRFLVWKLGFKLDRVENLFFSTILGLIFFTFLTYVFSWVNYLLALPVILLMDFLIIREKNWFPSVLLKTFDKSLATVIVLSIIFSFITLLSGEFGQTIRIISAHGADGLWHLSIINELKNNFPPEFPNLSGIPMRSYHFFSDFLLAKISNIFNISPSLLYFQFFPPLYALLWGTGVYALVKRWTGSKETSLWAVFLTMFGGSFAFIMHLHGHTQYSLDDMFGITQPASALVNPPFATSVVIIIASLFSILNYTKTRNNRWLFPLILFAGMIPLFKVHAAMILFAGLGFVTFIKFLQKDFVPIAMMAGVGVLFFSTFWVFAGGQAFLVYAPLWAPHNVLNDNLPWYGYREKQYTYSRLSVIKGMVEIELYALYVFIIGSLGTRVLGLLLLPIFLLRKAKLPGLFASTLIIMTFVSIFIPLFFIQSVQPFDIIQVAWYFLFLISLFAALGLGLFSNFLEKRFGMLFKLIFLLIFLILTLPSAYEKYKTYITLPPPVAEGPYYDALEFLKNQNSYSVLLQMPGEHIGINKESISSWYTFESSLVILAFGEKQGFLTRGYADYGIDKSSKTESLSKLMQYTRGLGSNAEEIEYELRINRISFIYSKEPLPLLGEVKGVVKVFENEAATIYKFEL